MMPVAVDKKVMFAPDCLEKDPPDSARSLLFHPMVPKRRRDKFGRDTTSHSDFVLSATVFPTGVRAPALEELQQKCGPAYRTETPRDAMRGVLPGESWPGSGPKILSLRKSKPSPRDTPRTQLNVRSSTDSLLSLKSYSWASKSKSKDVRDPMYINTYFPDERPLRFKESSLPRISKSRPWSVGESNPSKRFVKVNNEVRKSAGKIRAGTRIQGTPLKSPREQYNDTSNKADGEYFEVKRMSADQRVRQRGQDGCLFSQVRQCIRLIKNHDQNKGRQVDRPLKAEVGRYRPFSTTRIRTPCPSPIPTAGFMCREQDSADTYKQYVMTKTLQSRASSKSAGSVGNGVIARNNTAASTYYDSEILQSVADSNAPDNEHKPFSEFSNEEDYEGRASSESHSLGLDIRGESIPLPKSAKSSKSVKSKTIDHIIKSRVVPSPKKEVVLTRLRDRSAKTGSDISAPQETRHLCSPAPSTEVDPEPIQLDESGNPLIWRHSHLTSTPDSAAVIKIPAVAMSALSLDDTEDAETNDEG